MNITTITIMLLLIVVVAPKCFQFYRHLTKLDNNIAKLYIIIFKKIKSNSKYYIIYNLLFNSCRIAPQCLRKTMSQQSTRQLFYINFSLLRYISKSVFNYLFLHFLWCFIPTSRPVVSHFHVHLCY
jgi:hypothetical protein